jgi:hypothetical protein
MNDPKVEKALKEGIAELMTMPTEEFWKLIKEQDKQNLYKFFIKEQESPTGFDTVQMLRES